MSEYVFIGERRSPTAIKRGWTWDSGHLAAAQLFPALREAGITPEDQIYLNVFLDNGELNPNLRNLPSESVVVGMGLTTHAVLQELEIDHKTIVHPAARGTIRKKERYAEHIKKVLLGI